MIFFVSQEITCRICHYSISYFTMLFFPNLVTITLSNGLLRLECCYNLYRTSELAVRHEPEDTMLVHINAYVWQVFVNGRWDNYFNRFQGFENGITKYFALNLVRDHSSVRGIEILFIEESIAEVSGLTMQGKIWFSRRIPLPEFPELFLQPG